MFFIRDQDGDLHDLAGRHLCYSEEDGALAIVEDRFHSIILKAPEGICRQYQKTLFQEMVRLGVAVMNPQMDAPTIAGQLAREKAEKPEVPDADPEV